MENKVLAVVAGNELTEKDLNAIIMRYPEQNRECSKQNKERNN